MPFCLKRNATSELGALGDQYGNAASSWSKRNTDQTASVASANPSFSPRWKGENVATTEVADIVGLVDFVEEVNVYGVPVPGR